MIEEYFVGIKMSPLSIRLSSVNSVYFPKKLLVSKNIPKFALVHSSLAEDNV